jgi:hypothetical protein
LPGSFPRCASAHSPFPSSACRRACASRNKRWPDRSRCAGSRTSDWRTWSTCRPRWRVRTCGADDSIPEFAFIMVGQRLQQQARLADAIKFYETVLEVRPGVTDARNMLAGVSTRARLIARAAGRSMAKICCPASHLLWHRSSPDLRRPQPSSVTSRKYSGRSIVSGAIAGSGSGCQTSRSVRTVPTSSPGRQRSTTRLSTSTIQYSGTPCRR